MANNQPSVRYLAVQILKKVLSQKIYADAAIDQAFAANHLSDKDKALLVELVNGVIRWHGQLQWIIKSLYKGNYETVPPILLNILEVSLYQLTHLSKIPGYAAVSQGVDMAKAEGGKRWGNLVNAILRNYLRHGSELEFPTIEKERVSAIAIRHSHPEWIVGRWLRQFGLDNTIKFCEYNNKRPEISVRINTLKTDLQNTVEELEENGFNLKPSAYFSDFLKVEKAANLVQTDLFRQGFITIQDESTALAPLLLHPQKGDVILDMCAAPGGKTGYLSTLMGDEGVVFAVDVNLQRLNAVKQNKQRLNLKSMLPVCADARKIQMRPVDKILLDVPCSGLGVLARRADLRWRKTCNDIRSILKTQQSLLQRAAHLVKNGGSIVYSTCTLEPEETTRQIEWFLEKYPEFYLSTDCETIPGTFLSEDKYFISFPFLHGIDGAFAVKLKKRIH